MKSGQFRRAASLTLRPKRTKASIKFFSRDSKRANAMDNVLGLTTSTGELQEVLSPYMNGMQMSSLMEQAARTSMCSVAVQLVIASKLYKVKLPASTKKVKLTGTRQAAILGMHSLAIIMLQDLYEVLFMASFVDREKQVVLPKTGEKILSTISVLDPEMANASYKNSFALYQKMVGTMIGMFWALCFDMFKESPDTIFSETFDMMKQQYGPDFFEQ